MADQTGEPAADSLRRFLAERDTLCPNCNYNLRDLAANRCPECGWRIEFTATPPWSRSLGALFGLGFGAAPWAMIVVLVIVNTPPAESLWTPALLCVVPILICAAVFWAVARPPARRWMHRLAPWRRWMVTAACWALSPVMGVVYAMVLARLA